MRDELLLYYERELTFLRQMGKEFAEKYPKIASRLDLEADKCEDPHVERILEAFAFLAARVHLKIDDEFPEITEALLSVLYPHYLRPIPSMCVTQMHLDQESSGITTAQRVPRRSRLKSAQIQSVGTACIFETCYDTTVWPVSVTECEWKTPDRLAPPVKSNEAIGAFRIELKGPPGAMLSQLGMKNLRFYISAESQLANTIYELLFSNCVQILVRDPSLNSRVQPTILRPDEHLRPVGFAPQEAMLPYPRRSFEGYRLLQEYFAFPDKFLFFELSGLELAWIKGFKERAEIVFLISSFDFAERRQNLELGVNKNTFRLNCTPAINLFQQTCEPIRLDQRKYEYPIDPDHRYPSALEIFSVESVVGIDAKSNESRRYEPFYSYRHSSLRDKRQIFWRTHRRRTNRKNDDGTDVYLSTVDLSTTPVRPDADVLTVHALCTNRDLPSRLPFGNEYGDFELEGSASVKRIVSLNKPTPTIRPPMGKGAFWRLLSHLSLNYLSLADDQRAAPADGEIIGQFPGKDAFKELLKLYNYAGSAATDKQIEGILRVQGSRQFARVFSENGISFVRGVRVDLELDEEQFVGGGALLFSTVMEHFFALYVSMNSFSQLCVRSRQRKEILKEWPPRAGHKILL